MSRWSVLSALEGAGSRGDVAGDPLSVFLAVGTQDEGLEARGGAGGVEAGNVERASRRMTGCDAPRYACSTRISLGSGRIHGTLLAFG